MVYTLNIYNSYFKILLQIYKNILYILKLYIILIDLKVIQNDDVLGLPRDSVLKLSGFSTGRSQTEGVFYDHCKISYSVIVCAVWGHFSFIMSGAFTLIYFLSFKIH